MKVGDLVTYRGRLRQYHGLVGIITAKHPKARLVKVLIPARSSEPIQINQKHLEKI
jgi:ribosomal protein L21E